MEFTWGARETILLTLALATFSVETWLGSRGWQFAGWKKMRWFWALGVLLLPLIAVPGYLFHLFIGWRKQAQTKVRAEARG